nr:IS3 family transposase [Mycoavidus cysteinexigens]
MKKKSVERTKIEKLPRQKFTQEFRRQAVKPILEGKERVTDVAKRLSLSIKTIGNWLSQARNGKLDQMGANRREISEQEAELSRLRKENAELRMERTILKKAAAYFGKGIHVKYAFIKKQRHEYTLPMLCRALDVSKSGYLMWLGRKPSARSKENACLEIEIKVAHERTRGVYGSLRLHHELKECGWMVGLGRLKRLRRELGIRAKQKRKFITTTHSKHRLPIAENLLNQKFEANGPNQVWLTDITYVATAEGWLYLAAIKDLFTCEIVGYAMSDRMTVPLVSQALFRATTAKRPAAGLIHHSDRGSQYCAYEYQALLRQFKMQPSMSRTGSCYDNAPMESFWGSLKNELVHHRRYLTREHARNEISEYIELFYNRQRRHSRLGYLPPAIFAQQFYQQLYIA